MTCVATARGAAVLVKCQPDVVAIATGNGHTTYQLVNLPSDNSGLLFIQTKARKRGFEDPGYNKLRMLAYEEQYHACLMEDMIEPLHPDTV